MKSSQIKAAHDDLWVLKGVQFGWTEQGFDTNIQIIHL